MYCKEPNCFQRVNLHSARSQVSSNGAFTFIYEILFSTLTFYEHSSPLRGFKDGRQIPLIRVDLPCFSCASYDIRIAIEFSGIPVFTSNHKLRPLEKKVLLTRVLLQLYSVIISLASLGPSWILIWLSIQGFWNEAVM